MAFYCSSCKEAIQFDEYKYSKDNYGKILCWNCQKECKKGFPNKTPEKKDTPKPTREARKLYDALKRKGVPAELEKFDGYKHIDIAVVAAKINIEVDGGQHHNPKQALADLKRTYYSFKKGYFTLRIPNSLVKESLDETADCIVDILNKSVEQLEEDTKPFSLGRLFG